MILRRIANAFRKQDWITVFIETLIVIFGVFIGLQVNNWNEGRAARVQEMAYLQQLKDEMSHNVQMIAYQERFVERVVESGYRALTFVEQAERCETNCDALLVDFFHASQVWGTGYKQTKYEEMNRIGLPTDENIRLTVDRFYQFVDGWDVVNAAPPIYREHARRTIPPAAISTLWRQCYRILDGTFEQLTQDCQDDLNSADVDAALTRIQENEDIAGDLRFWIGQNEYALQFYPDMSSRADLAIAEIEKSLGATP